MRKQGIRLLRYRVILAIVAGFAIGALGGFVFIASLPSVPSLPSLPSFKNLKNKVSEAYVQRKATAVKRDKPRSEENPAPAGQVAKFKNIGKPTEPKPLEIVDVGFVVGKSGSNRIYYAIIIKNPNADYLVEAPLISINMKDDKGEAIGVKQQVVGQIEPLQSLAWAGQAYPEDGIPTNAKFSVSASGWRKRTSAVPTEFKVADFEVVSNFLGFTATGKVYNPEDKNGNVTLTVILKNSKGKIVTGFNGFVNDIPAKSSRAFRLIPSGLPNVDYSRALAFVQPW